MSVPFPYRARSSIPNIPYSIGKLLANSCGAIEILLWTLPQRISIAPQLFASNLPIEYGIFGMELLARYGNGTLIVIFCSGRSLHHARFKEDWEYRVPVGVWSGGAVALLCGVTD